MKHCIALVILFAELTCNATTIVGRVVSVADGDTITVLDTAKTQHKIRLAGIDAPEKSQPFGNRSKLSLSDLVFSKSVLVDTDKVDKYKRNVGKVLVDGVDANLEQIKRGMAWHYKAYEREQSALDRKHTPMRKTKSKSLGEVYGLMLSLLRPGISERRSEMSINHLPTTIEAAVRLLKSVVPDDEQKKIICRSQTS
jgi:hypothetical protein